MRVREPFVVKFFCLWRVFYFHLKGIASLRIQQRQAEKLRRYLLGRRGWEDAAAVAASFGGLSLDDTPAGVAAGDQAAGGAASASALDDTDIARAL